MLADLQRCAPREEQLFYEIIQNSHRLRKRHRLVAHSSIFSSATAPSEEAPASAVLVLSSEDKAKDLVSVGSH